MLSNSACKQNSLLWRRGYLCVPSLGYGASQRNCMLLNPASLLSENVASHLQRSMSLWLNVQPMKHISAKILRQCSKHTFLLTLKQSQRKFKHILEQNPLVVNSPRPTGPVRAVNHWTIPINHDHNNINLYTVHHMHILLQHILCIRLAIWVLGSSVCGRCHTTCKSTWHLNKSPIDGPKKWPAKRVGGTYQVVLRLKSSLL